MPIDDSDWRRIGQEHYLRGVTLIYCYYRQYPANPDWDHDHCEFCRATFTLADTPGALGERSTPCWAQSQCDTFAGRARKAPEPGAAG